MLREKRWQSGLESVSENPAGWPVSLWPRPHAIAAPVILFFPPGSAHCPRTVQPQTIPNKGAPCGPCGSRRKQTSGAGGATAKSPASAATLSFLHTLGFLPRPVAFASSLHQTRLPAAVWEREKPAAGQSAPRAAARFLGGGRINPPAHQNIQHLMNRDQMKTSSNPKRPSL
jgi:hypothetical protein